MKLSIIMAVYNESGSVLESLTRACCQELPDLDRELVVIESNSTDGSREICQEFASKSNAEKPGLVKLILQDRPAGKGNAVREGLRQASGDIILIQDADLEYDTRDYPALVEPILAGKAEFVLGSRHLSAGHWKIRRFEVSPLKALLLNMGGMFFHRFFNLMYSQSLTDPTTMYKVFRRSCIERLHFVSNRFDFDFELVAKLIRAGFIPFEVPVSYVSRGFEDGKKVCIFRDPLTWIRAIVQFRFSRLYITGKELPGLLDASSANCQAKASKAA